MGERFPVNIFYCKKQCLNTMIAYKNHPMVENKSFLSYSQTYIPSTRTSFGVWGLPRGEEYYAACLKWQLSVNWTADEIHEIGIREVNRVYGEMEKVFNLT